MSDFFILFGNTAKLSRLEFESIYPDLKLEAFDEHLFKFSANEEQNPQEMIDTLGGAVKIFEIKKVLDKNISDDQLAEVLVDLLAEIATEPYFAIHQEGKGQKDINNAWIKKLLKQKGIKSRYFRTNLEASALVSHKDQAIELILLFEDAPEGKLYLTQTVAVQNIDNWTKKDRQKPYFDRKKGMLPPKLARMMVNVALGQWRQAGNQERPLLYDPFCGTGTTLIEAILRDCQVYGSDLDERAVFGTRDNIEWLEQEYELQAPAKVFYGDVGNLPLNQFDRKVDLLVTEPFLGKQTPDDRQLPNVFRGLEKMYLGAFKNFAKILNEGAFVFMIFPKVQGKKKVYSMEGFIDKLASRGYNLQVKPVLYAREGARVQREIYLFKFDPKI
jgi:tRNA G10  N-methylase Trm11